MIYTSRKIFNKIKRSKKIAAHTDPWVVWAGITIRTPGGRDVKVMGDFPGWLGRTVTIDVPVADC